MINPNAVHNSHGLVTKLSRSYNGSLNVTVQLDNGRSVEELGFIYHKTLAVGDRVAVQIGFSIMSDRYGIKAIRKKRLTK